MTIPVSYFSAAKRHCQDAELLFSHGRNSNAGQLYGFVAECGIKALLIGSGYSSDPATGEIIQQKPEKLREHIHILTTKINTISHYLSGRNAARYIQMVPKIGDFDDWNTCHRYYLDSAIPSSITKWRLAADEVMRMLDQAKQDGLSI